MGTDSVLSQGASRLGEVSETEWNQAGVVTRAVLGSQERGRGGQNGVWVQVVKAKLTIHPWLWKHCTLIVDNLEAAERC